MSKNTIYEDAVINGYKASTAKDYADTYGRAFNAISIDPNTFFGKWQAYKANYQGEDHFPTSSSTWQNTTWTFNNDYSGEYYAYNNGSIVINWQIDGNTIIVNKAVLEYDGTDLFIKTISDGEEIIYYFKKANSGSTTTATTTATTTTTTKTTTTTTKTTSTTTTTTTTTPHESTYQGLKYEISNREVHIKGYTEELPSVVNIPAKIEGISVTSIERGAFYDCTSLTKITIPDSVTSIGAEAFYSCTSLTKITIPDSVTSIGFSAFRVCTSLKEITIPNSVTSIGGNAFSGTPWLDAKRKENPLVVINGILIDGQTCSGAVTIPDSVTSIGDSAFYYCKSLTKITIPSSVTSIGNGAFWGCTSLKEITIPSSVTSIGNGAFWGCTSLKEITIPDSVTSIGADAFYSCTSLTKITIPDSVTSIGYEAFRVCTSLKEITIPDSVTSIGYEAFSNTPWLDAKRKENPLVVINGILIDGQTCSGAVTIPDSVTSIGGLAFNKCYYLKKITIPDSVTSIGSNAFQDCDNLTEITIPENLTSIGYGTFSGCTHLKEITIPDSVTNIEAHAFYNCRSLTIKGYIGSYAETFANKNRIPFESLGDAPKKIMGDVNNDGSVSIADAVSLQNFLLGRTKTLGNWKNADLCKDNRIDVFDMVLMRRLLIEKMN